jgi:hypothetical protein
MVPSRHVSRQCALASHWTRNGIDDRAAVTESSSIGFSSFRTAILRHITLEVAVCYSRWVLAVSLYSSPMTHLYISTNFEAIRSYTQSPELYVQDESFQSAWTLLPAAMPSLLFSRVAWVWYASSIAVARASMRM